MPDVRQPLQPKQAPPEQEETQIDLPHERLQFFLSDRYKQSLDSVKEEYRISQEDSNFISDLDRLVMANNLDLEGYLVALEDELKLDPKILKNLQAELLANRFVPFGDDLKPSAIEVAKKHELDLPKTEYYRIYRRPLTYSGAVSEIAEIVGISILGSDVRNRLRDLIVSKVKNGQVNTQALEVITRGESFGGLGFDKKIASKTLAAINDLASRAKIITEEEYTEWLAKKTIGASSKNGEAVLHEKNIKTEALKDDLQQKRRDTETTLEKAIEDAISKLSFKPPSSYLERRLRNAISSRLRSVRSETDFRELLSRPEKVGGVGLKPEAARKISQEVELMYKEFHDAIALDEMKSLEKQMLGQKAKVEERRKKDLEEHAEWFEKKIRKNKGLIDVQSAPLNPQVRPSIDSVQHDRPHLMGLMGELASISREDFRRMGDTPKASADSIRKRIETISEESYEQRIRAYEAFRQSPLQKEYLELVRSSFNEGRPVAEIAKDLRAQGKDSLVPDEIAAIIQLNSTLQY